MFCCLWFSLGGTRFPVIPGSADLTEKNSRLRATGICRQAIDIARCFRCQNGTFRAKSKKFPVFPPETGIWPTGGRSLLGGAGRPSAEAVRTGKAARDEPAGGAARAAPGSEVQLGTNTAFTLPPG